MAAPAGADVLSIKKKLLESFPKLWPADSIKKIIRGHQALLPPIGDTEGVLKVSKDDIETNEDLWVKQPSRIAEEYANCSSKNNG